MESDAEDNSEYESGSDGEDEQFMSCDADASEDEANEVSDMFELVFSNGFLQVRKKEGAYWKKLHV